MYTPLMNLNLPTVGALGTLGPTWAQNINDAFSLVDSHDHSAGKGSTIPIGSILINSDLNMNLYNIVNVRSYRMYNGPVLTDTADKTSIYASSGNLFYNNAAGFPVQITAGNGINLTSIGTIGGDYGTSTASVIYTSISKLFTFTSSPGVASNMTCGPIFIYDPIIAGNYIKLQVPSGLSSSFNVTLPASLPISTLPVSMDNLGNMSTGQILSAQIADLNVATNNLADSSVTTIKIAASNVTRDKLATTEQIPTGTIIDFAGISAPTGWLLCDGSAVSRTTYAALYSVLSLVKGTFTVTIATPAVVTLNSHGLVTGNCVELTTSGALPTGLSVNTNYYVIFKDPNSFWLALSYADAIANTKINTSGSQSGVHTCNYVPYGISTAANFNLPDAQGRVVVGSGSGSGLTNRILAEKLGTETITHNHTNATHNHLIQTVYAPGGGNLAARVFDASGTAVTGTSGYFNLSGLGFAYGDLSGVLSATGASGKLYTDNDSTATNSTTINVEQPFLTLNKIIKY